MLNIIKSVFNGELEICHSYSNSILDGCSKVMRSTQTIVAERKPGPGAKISLRRRWFPVPSLLRVRGQQLKGLLKCKAHEQLPVDAPERYLFPKIEAAAELLFVALMHPLSEFATMAYDPATDQQPVQLPGRSKNELRAIELVDAAYLELVGGEVCPERTTDTVEVGMYDIFPADVQFEKFYYDSRPGTRSFHLLCKAIRVWKEGKPMPNADPMERWQDRFRFTSLRKTKGKGLTSNPSRDLLQRVFVAGRLRLKLRPIPVRQKQRATKLAAARAKPRTGYIAQRERFECFRAREAACRTAAPASTSHVELAWLPVAEGTSAVSMCAAERDPGPGFQPPPAGLKPAALKGHWVLTSLSGRCPHAAAYEKGWKSQHTMVATAKVLEHKTAVANGATVAANAPTAGGADDEGGGDERGDGDGGDGDGGDERGDGDGDGGDERGGGDGDEEEEALTEDGTGGGGDGDGDEEEEALTEDGTGG